MSQPSIRGVAHNTASASVSCTVDISGIGVQPGDIMIAYVGITGNTAISVTAVANLTWVGIGGQVANGASMGARMFVHRVSSVALREPSTWTFNTSATPENWAVTIVVYTAMDFFNKAVATTTTASSTTDNAPTVVNTSLGNLIVVAGYASASNSVFSGPPAGYFIEDQIVNAAGGICVAIVDTQIAAPFPAGTGVLAVTTSNAGLGIGTTSTWTPNETTLEINDSVIIP